MCDTSTQCVPVIFETATKTVENRSKSDASFQCVPETSDSSCQFSPVVRDISLQCDLQNIAGENKDLQCRLSAAQDELCRLQQELESMHIKLLLSPSAPSKDGHCQTDIEMDGEIPTAALVVKLDGQIQDLIGFGTKCKKQLADNVTEIYKLRRQNDSLRTDINDLRKRLAGSGESRNNNCRRSNRY